MKLLALILALFLAGCTTNNYYIIEQPKPKEEPRPQQQGINMFTLPDNFNGFKYSAEPFMMDKMTYYPNKAIDL